MALQLTYDSVEDRVLFLSHQEVRYPSWWLSRRSILRLIQSLNSAVAAHYETEKILQKVSETQTSETTNRDGNARSEQSVEQQTLDEYRQAHLESSETSVERHSEHVSEAQKYPYARSIRLDLLENNRVALVLSDGVSSGLKLEFHEDGVHQFADMCLQVVRRCRW
ncbi:MULTISPECIES: hypothetical protein [unclassified Oleiphilus]|uniref:hypothetical protein n=2 Tax=Oleiphilus TaxID=141450 RepID=UPI0007C32EAE|nr:MULTISPECIES: hypothetical protein [unclassified Oleiphilus]KZY71388.1 hypothetical protein A3738_14880 [Oleiphilus sp. HI0066]KZY71533.1 hypothetical protein A3739_04860 [Oleiphilus sp. HI0067]MCH2160065.1 hypothetical protein [Oleiphilaceae bacterium]